MFNDDYDRSLELILAGNKSKREMIGCFLNDIPLELLNKLYKSFDEYQDYLEENKDIFFLDRDEIDLSGRFITTEDFLYFYNIEPITGALDLGMSIYYNKEETMLFKMTIYPFSLKDYMDLQMFNEFGLGGIYYNFSEKHIEGKKHMINFDSTDFSLVRCPLRDVLASSDKSRGITRRYSFVNINNAINLLNIKEVSRNRLVRNRKKYR